VPYHLRVSTLTGSDFALDLSREQLERRFLTPRLEGRPVTVAGRTLGWGEIARITIGETRESSEELRTRIRDRNAGMQSAVGIPYGEFVINEGHDVTDELVTEPVGAHAPERPAADEWFHVRVERGLLRQGEEFNLHESELVERFVGPWRAGQPVTAHGKSFAPSDAKLKIYVGPRLTTSQLAMWQGWLNAIKFGEDVTDEMLAGRSRAQVQRAPREPDCDPDPRAVAVAYGRDDHARQAMFDFLRALDLMPLEWGELIARTGSTSPYNGDVVRTALRDAKVVIVLFTPDEEARLHVDLRGDDDHGEDSGLFGQPRANVILEAGMALVSHPGRTVIVEIGRLRGISNLGGLNAIRIAPDDISAGLNDLASRLSSAGCPVNTHGSDWLDTSRFADLAALQRRAEPAGAVDGTSAKSSPSLAIDIITPSTIVAELDTLVEVAARDLLGSGRELTAAEVTDWAARTEVAIRTRCSSAFAARFQAEGRGLAPNDELRTKIHFIHDDLVAKVRGGWFSTPLESG